METHAIDLLRLSVWALTSMGALLLALIVYGGKTVLGRLDKLEELLAGEGRALRDLLHSHDVRITRIEAHCSLYHADDRTGGYRLNPHANDNGNGNGGS